MIFRLFCDICNLKTHYEIYGKENSANILFLHGWGVDISLYRNMFALLAEKYRVYAVDLAGFGETDEPKYPFSIDDYCGFIKEFVKFSDIKSVVLMGHSFGGRICIKLAADKNLPFEIEKMILVDSAGIKPKKTVKNKISSAKYKIKKNFAKIFLSKEKQEALRRKYGSPDYVNASPMMRSVLVKTVNEDLTPLLKKISTETLLIWGKKDTATPLSDAYIMEKNMQNAGLAAIDNAGHFPFSEQPFVFSRILISYLKIKE